MSLLQKIGVVVLAWFALALIMVSAWNLLLGFGRDRDEEELREAVRRKVRDDERSGKTGDNKHAD
jgi:hypothetical protein